MDLEPAKVFRLGLTGSIGMGKTTVAGMFARQGIPVLDADVVVHRLYARGGAAVAPVGQAFPGVVVDEAVSRPELAKHVMGSKEALKRLEELVHPLVAEERERWLRSLDVHRHPLALLDIPLLYETHSEKTVDAVVVATASDAVQRERVLARPSMTQGKFQAILARQLPDHEKRRRADFLIHTGLPLKETEASVADLLDYLREHKL